MSVPKRITLLFLCLALSLLSGGEASAAAKRARPAKPEKKAATVRELERTATVNVASSDVFLKNSSKSEHVTEVLLGDEFKVAREDEEWAYGSIPSQKEYSGWVRKKDLFFPLKDSPFGDKSSVHIRTMRTKISFRNGSSMNIYAGTRLPLLRKNAESYEVILPDGTTGFLASDAAWIESEGFGKNITADDIMRAVEFEGSMYKWGGITAGGMDCSGFVYTVFRINGIYLRRDSYMQAEEGVGVSPDDLKAGDLLFFKGKKEKRITHVGIYVGEGKFIHSSRGRKGVYISSLAEDSFRESFVTARRILGAVISSPAPGSHTFSPARQAS